MKAKHSRNLQSSTRVSLKLRHSQGIILTSQIRKKKMGREENWVYLSVTPQKKRKKLKLKNADKLTGPFELDLIF